MIRSLTYWAVGVLVVWPGAGLRAGDAPGIPSKMPERKLIAAGWDSPTPELLAKHIAEIEKTPFDGVRLRFEIEGDEGRKVAVERLINATPWKREWFAGTIAELRKVQNSRLKHNFLGVGAGASIDWFDDAGWEQAIDHFRIVAWVAKEGGLKGLFFDPEKGTRLPAFSYNRQLKRTDYTFAEYAAQVRKRGRQVMEAMAAEYPDMTIFTTFLIGGASYSPFYRTGQSQPHHYYHNGTEAVPSGPRGPMEIQEQIAPVERIEGGSYNLLPAFLNGWLDAIPPQMTLVDGLEHTYTAVEENAFIRWAHGVHTTAVPMVAPENRAKYRAQVQAAFGLYLDAYTNPSGSRHYVGPDLEGNEGADAPRVQRFETAVRNAFNNTDGYVWLWGEKHRWWPTDLPRVRPETWEEVAPGISEALRAGLDPGYRARQSLEALAKQHLGDGDALLGGRNLATQGDFTSVAGWAPEGAGNHPPVYDSAVGHRQPGALRMDASGVSTRDIPVSKGKGIYAVRVWVREEGGAKGSVRIRWRKGSGPYLYAHANNIELEPDASTRTADGWVRAQGVIVVPPIMNRIAVQLTAQNPEGKPGVVWFDDLEVVSLAEADT